MATITMTFDLLSFRFMPLILARGWDTRPRSPRQVETARKSETSSRFAA
jgi:hypothetical protein